MIGSPDSLFDHIRALDLPWLQKQFAAGSLSFAADHVGADNYAELGRRIAIGDFEWVHHLLSQVPGVDASTAAAITATLPDPVAKRNSMLQWAIPLLIAVAIGAMFVIKALV